MKRALLGLVGFSALFISLTGIAMAISVNAPEPSSLMLLATGGGGLGTWLVVKARGKK